MGQQTDSPTRRHTNNNKQVGETPEVLSNPCSSTIVNSLQSFFYWYGTLLARYPVKSILIALVIPLSCSLGLLRFKTENNPYKLWIPQDSDYIRDQEWLWQNFPDDIRFHSVILTGDNVLTPLHVQKLLEIHQIAEKTVSEDGNSFADICYRVPMVDTESIKYLLEDFDDDYDYDYQDEDEEKETNGTLSETLETSLEKRSLSRFRRVADDFDPSVELYAGGDYCNLIDGLIEQKCMEFSILELWAKDNYRTGTQNKIENLTQQDIVDAINLISISPVFDREQDFSKYLGDIKRNSTGHIIGAGAMYIRFFGKVNTSAISDDESAAVSKGSPVDQFSLNWEQKLIENLIEFREKDDSVFFNIAKSFSDLSARAIEGDALLFGIGTSTVFIYVQIMLGKFNFVQQRPMLSAVGMGCYGLSILTSYGLCSGLGLLFSPLHAIIPFLMMGIGVDDMFVIIQSLHNLEEKSSSMGMSTVEKMGETMRHAGVAITVTSLTDFIVFIIGAITVLPALRSFCIYCAVGIISVYFYQATIFSAFLSIDIRRVKQKRNGCLPFIKHEDWTPNKISQRNFAKEMFGELATLIEQKWFKALVLIVTAAFAGVGLYGLTELKQEFNPIDFIPQDSYLAGWMRVNNDYFPKEGERVVVNIGDIDYTAELSKLDGLVSALLNETEIISQVDSWYIEFRKYATENHLVGSEEWFQLFQTNSNKFYEVLTQFLFSPAGSKYKRNFNFMTDLICGEAAPQVQLSSIQLTHKLFTSPTEWIPAMNKIKSLVRDANFSSRAFPTGTEYASWETDEVIGQELYQNLGLSLLCVFLMTLLLIASLKGCLFVLLCVLITLVDVGGFMHFWGLTIDVISCVNLVIAVGLVVDYSAHIVHSFLLQTGSRMERVRSTLTDIGPAVLNGGFSTFLAFIFTAGSTSHVFITFFKIFLLVVLFGLFHGLVFLPTLLAIIGPQAHVTADKSSTKEVEVKEIKEENVSQVNGKAADNLGYELELKN